MEIFNILFESAEIVKKKAKEIERMNIVSLQKSNREIQALLKKSAPAKKPDVIYVHDNGSYPDLNNFPVDYRIVKA